MVAERRKPPGVSRDVSPRNRTACAVPLQGASRGTGRLAPFRYRGREPYGRTGMGSGFVGVVGWGEVSQFLEHAVDDSLEFGE